MSETERHGAQQNNAERDEAEQRDVLAEWCARVIRELDLDGLAVDIDAILALAGTAAHTVRRPAAPLTTYLLGLAVGRDQAAGADSAEAAARATAAIEALAAAYPHGDA